MPRGKKESIPSKPQLPSAKKRSDNKITSYFSKTSEQDNDINNSNNKDNINDNGSINNNIESMEDIQTNDGNSLANKKKARKSTPIKSIKKSDVVNEANSDIEMKENNINNDETIKNEDKSNSNSNSSNSSNSSNNEKGVTLVYYKKKDDGNENNESTYKYKSSASKKSPKKPAKVKKTTTKKEEKDKDKKKNSTKTKFDDDEDDKYDENDEDKKKKTTAAAETTSITKVSELKTKPLYEVEKIPSEGYLYNSNFNKPSECIHLEDYLEASFSFISSKESDSYLPIEKKSMDFSFSNDSKKKLNLSLFESIENSSKSHEIDFITFCGGNAYCLDWCPSLSSDECENKNQFLAISAHKDCVSSHKKRKTYTGRNIIQIYQYQLSSNQDNVNQQIELPKLVFSIAHEGNCIWDLKWMPHGGYYKRVNQDTGEMKCIRLGVLAALLGDGSIKVWPIPHPDLVDEKFTNLNSKKVPLSKIIKIEPIFDQILNSNNRLFNDQFLSQSKETSDYFGTCLNWSNCYDKSSPWLIIGCTNGLVEIYDLNIIQKQNKLINNNNNEINYIHPIYHNCSNWEINGVAFCPLDKNLFIVNNNREIEFWDRREKSPTKIIKEFNSTSSVKWLNTTIPTLVLSEDTNIKVFSLTSLLSTGYPTNQFEISDFDLSKDLKYCVSGSIDGELICILIYTDRKKYKTKISSIQKLEKLKLIQDEKDDSRLIFLNKSEKLNDLTLPRPIVGSKALFQYTAIQNLSYPDKRLSIRKVSFNKNLGCGNTLLAYSTNQGFIRIINFSD